jgi:hypothetical protein
MLVVVEGADGAGKTTLIGRLQDVLGEAEVRHKGPPERDPVEEYAVDIQDYRPGSGRHVLCDRWHWGELVYGPVLRGKTRFTRETFAHVEKVLLARGAVVVHATGDPGILGARLETRGDDLVRREQLPALIDGFHRVHGRSELPCVQVRVDDNSNRAINRILDAADASEQRAAPLRRYGTYVGPPWPQYLLLGEKRHGAPPYRHEAAFTPAPATSGRYLHRALDDQILRRSGFANAREEHVRDLWETLGRPRICALGRSARDTCQFQGVPFGAVPHPQFVRRFHYGALREYGNLIREVLTRNQEDRLEWRPS